MTTLFAIAISSLLLAPAANAGTSTDQTQPAGGKRGSQSGATTGSDDATAVLSSLHATNQLEIQFGQLAESKGQSQKVRDFGKQLVKDHQAADKKVQALASQKGITLGAEKAPSAEDERHMDDQKKALSRLQSLDGQQFDDQFLSEMAKGHEHTISMLDKSKATVQDKDVDKLVSSLRPVLEKHRAMATGTSSDEGSQKNQAPAHER
jgi:putative membrane protein